MGCRLMVGQEILVLFIMVRQGVAEASAAQPMRYDCPTAGATRRARESVRRAHFFTGVSSNGRTRDFGSLYHGSNPCAPTKINKAAHQSGFC